MRDLLYKNLTSVDRSRKVIASSEITDKQGIHSVVRRHFTYIVRQVENTSIAKPQPYLYVLKEKKSREKQERFFCKIKGSMFAVNSGKIYLIYFLHTLSIKLEASKDNNTGKICNYKEDKQI